MIKVRICGLLLASLVLAAAQAENTSHCEKSPCVVLETSAGNMLIELNQERAPESVRNFLSYVDKGYYNGRIFHRVIPGFMIQGGGFDTDFEEGELDKPIVNESRNGLSNLRGTIAMARTAIPDSATSQFFINLVDNRRLDASEYRWGYAVFGRVVEGMEVADAIAEVPTGPAGPFMVNVPQASIVIERATRLESAEASSGK
ncbi:MAG: peptidyl-prolyl cis-trans isomerase [Gammaproteobacteria bacterium]|nr:peptidyl-prolyl cis-trans isomerase [Gammaproteobacteria bacterium]